MTHLWIHLQPPVGGVSCQGVGLLLTDPGDSLGWAHSFICPAYCSLLGKGSKHFQWFSRTQNFGSSGCRCLTFTHLPHYQHFVFHLKWSFADIYFVP